MLTFPLHNAALDLKGKPPEELPHGLLTIPPEVRELVEMERAKHWPEAFAKAQLGLLNDWTMHWYFEDLCQEVTYRQTPDGPEVLAVGFDEALALQRAMSPEEHRKLKGYSA
ncbi:MAG TPA: hypothetical protein VKA46_07600 [Gemmataceae bacterium]|nr:hypothetical protein [Gemmataceae bacterium]